MKLFQKLRELEAKATSGEWQIGHVSEINGCAEIESADLNYVATVGYGVMHRQDQSFICEMRNSLPKLLHAIDVMQEALASISKNSCCELCQEAKLVSLSALDKAREIAGAE